MKKTILSYILWAALCISTPKQTAGSDADPQVIFSNYNFADTLFMNRAAVQRIFTRKDVRWSNGKSIIVYTKPIDSVEHKAFVANTLNMSLYRFQRELESSTYSAKAIPLNVVDNDYTMMREVKTHEGAIGYVNYRLVLHNKKIILIDE